jgi:hypothetical protein
VIEAIIEDLGIKKKLFAELEGILARMPSSPPTPLPVRYRDRRGLNSRSVWWACTSSIPPPCCHLVEVVPGLATAMELPTR